MPPRGQPRRLRRFAFAQFLHLDFGGLAALHPPEHVDDAGGVLGAPAMFADGDEVAALKRGDQLSRLFSVAIGFERHALDSFVEGSHSAKSICCGWWVRPVSCASS